MSTRKPWEHAKSSGSESDELATRFVASLDVDTRLYDADIRGSEAHATALHDAGLIGQTDLDAIAGGLADIRREIESAPDGVASWPGWKVELEDVHMCVEAALIEKVGEPGRRLHTGRSRNDQVALDLRLWMRDACVSLEQSIDGLMLAFEDLAEREGDGVMSSYTHLQRAQPICIGGELMAWHTMLAKSRGAFARLRTDPSGLAESPLGSGALAGSALPLDRNRSASLLGFDTISANSLEATASRDDALEMLFIMARTAMQMSRWAEQWVIYASVEFGFILLDDAHTTGSSMMPQKRNPDMLELIRGKCGGVYGDLIALMTICKGLTIGYNRDLQEDKTHLFRAYDTVIDCVEMSARIVRAAGFNNGRITDGIDRGYPDATSLAEYLVTRGIPFRSAHQIVGAIVAGCIDSGTERLSLLTTDQIGAAVAAGGHDASLVGEDVREWLGAGNVAARYRSPGNAGIGYRDTLARARASRSERAR